MQASGKEEEATHWESPTASGDFVSLSTTIGWCMLERKLAPLKEHTPDSKTALEVAMSSRESGNSDHG